ncbi:MAG: hypothetical protein Q9224_004498 [Gallowayella concinna]
MAATTVTVTLERTLGEIRELLDNAGNPQHLLGVLDAALSRVAKDKSSTLAIEAKQREFEERRGELSKWEEQLAAREEKVKLSESWLSENIRSLTSGMQSLEITKSSAGQDAEQLQGLISSNEAIRSKLQADQQETTRLQGEREAALNQREASLDSRKDTMDAYLTSRGRELQQLQMTLLNNATTQQKYQEDGEATRRAHWSELIQRQKAFDAENEERDKAFEKHNALARDAVKAHFNGLKSRVMILMDSLNHVTQQLHENRRQLNKDNHQLSGNRQLLHDNKEGFEILKAEVVALSEEADDVARVWRAEKDKYTRLAPIFASPVDPFLQYEVTDEEDDKADPSRISSAAKRAFQPSPTDTSPEKDTAPKRTRSDAGTGSPENVRRHSPVFRRPSGGSLRSPSKLPRPQSHLGQQSQSASQFGGEAGPAPSPDDLPPSLAAAWGQVRTTGIDTASLDQLLVFFRAWIEKKHSKPSDMPPAILSRCANGVTGPICLTSLLRSKKVGDFGDPDGSTACKECSRGNRPCFRVSWVSEDAKLDEHASRRWLLERRQQH